LGREAYDALCAWSWTRGDAAFIHQHIVDAFAAQQADEHTKPIAVTFALVGLYLFLEKGWNGREVQRAHMTLAARKRPWPAFTLPPDRGAMTAADVLRAAEGPARETAIRDWCASVWSAFAGDHAVVVELLHRYGID
jgi:hypothetical protein